MTEVSRKSWGQRFGYVCGAIILVWLATAAAFLIGIPGLNVGNRGTFGDMFGGLTCLFTGFAFAGVIISNMMQQEELKLTRDTLQAQKTELELTRTELAGQHDQMKLQNRHVERQSAEGTFFRMLELHRAKVDNLSTAGKRERTGQQMLLEIYVGFRKRWEFTLSAGKTLSLSTFAKVIERREAMSKLDNELDRLSYFYEDAFSTDRKMLQSYFRNFWLLVDFTVEAFKDDDHRNFMQRLIFAQLSSVELALIFYHILCDKDVSRPLVREIVQVGFFKFIDNDVALLKNSTVVANESWGDSVPHQELLHTFLARYGPKQ